MKLRLLKVIVQPVFVLDDGDNLTEESAKPITVPAAQWPQFAAVTFEEQVEKLRAEVERQ